MKNRGQKQAAADDQEQAAIEGVERRKELAARRMQRVDLAHTAQNHRGIEQGIDPRQIFVIMVPAHSDQQRDGDQKTRKAEPTEKTFGKSFARDRFFGMVFKHF